MTFQNWARFGNCFIGDSITGGCGRRPIRNKYVRNRSAAANDSTGQGPVAGNHVNPVRIGLCQVLYPPPGRRQSRPGKWLTDWHGKLPT
jgi:hypothetical protein